MNDYIKSLNLIKSNFFDVRQFLHYFLIRVKSESMKDVILSKISSIDSCIDIIDNLVNNYVVI